MAGQAVSAGLCSRYKRGPYAAFRQFYTGVKKLTSVTTPCFSLVKKQEMQADASHGYMDDIFNANPVTYPYSTDPSSVFIP